MYTKQFRIHAKQAAHEVPGNLAIEAVGEHTLEFIATGQRRVSGLFGKRSSRPQQWDDAREACQYHRHFHTRACETANLKNNES